MTAAIPVIFVLVVLGFALVWPTVQSRRALRVEIDDLRRRVDDLDARRTLVHPRPLPKDPPHD